MELLSRWADVDSARAAARIDAQLKADEIVHNQIILGPSFGSVEEYVGAAACRGDEAIR